MTIPVLSWASKVPGGRDHHLPGKEWVPGEFGGLYDCQLAGYDYQRMRM
jgi:hypothetical protein